MTITDICIWVRDECIRSIAARNPGVNLESPAIISAIKIEQFCVFRNNLIVLERVQVLRQQCPVHYISILGLRHDRANHIAAFLFTSILTSI